MNKDDSENLRLLLKYISPEYTRISEDTKAQMLVRWLEQEEDINWSWVFSPLEDELYT